MNDSKEQEFWDYLNKEQNHLQNAAENAIKTYQSKDQTEQEEMPVSSNVITIDGYTVQSFEEWLASGGKDQSESKEIKRGTETPEILMPGSPLEDLQTSETVPETVAFSVDTEPVDYMPMITAGCGFLIGVLITSLFFIAKINRIRTEYERW